MSNTVRIIRKTGAICCLWFFLSLVSLGLNESISGGKYPIEYELKWAFGIAAFAMTGSYLMNKSISELAK